MSENINILIPLPSYGFDQTKAAIPWKTLTNNGIKITFATPNGTPAHGEKVKLAGKYWKYSKGCLLSKDSLLNFLG